MDEKTLELLRKATKSQYILFLRNAIGAMAYQEGKQFQKENQTRRQRQDGITPIGKYSDNSAFIYLIEWDYGEKTFHIKSDGGREEFWDSRSRFDSLGDSFLFCLLVAVIDRRRIEESILKEIDPYDLSLNLLLKRPNGLSFILGAGVNRDSRLKQSMKGWQELIDGIRNQIRARLHIPAEGTPCCQSALNNCQRDVKDELVKFELSICNTNYTAPEILKGLFPQFYPEALYSFLYDGYNSNHLDVKNNPELTDTSLYQVARILCSRGAGRVLTFNYDCLLEDIFEKNFNPIWQSVYYRQLPDVSKTVYIIHSHGYIPYPQKKNFKMHKVVLSTFEYLDGYSLRHYPKKRLEDQLNDSNYLIGNSLSDYEEQKVFYTNYLKYPSRWNFILFKKCQDVWMDAYKTIFFMGMGVLPLFFDDYDGITDFLKTL